MPAPAIECGLCVLIADKCRQHGRHLWASWSTFVGNFADVCRQLLTEARRSRRGAADVQEAIAKGIRGNSRPSPQVATIHPRAEKASKKADV